MRGYRTLAAVSAAALLSAAGTAQATWSILLVDTRTGEIALGSATCLTSFDLRANTPVIITGVGAATAQSFVDSSGRNRVRIRDGLALGLTPSEILADLSTFDSGHQTRQYGIVDTTGLAATFSGTGAGAWAGGTTGEIDGVIYAVQGNLLTGPAVVDDAVAAIITTPGDLAEKLMAGMEAAQAKGGDARCSCTPLPIPCGTPPAGFLKSADIGYMMIARTGDTDACNGIYQADPPVRDVAIGDTHGDGLPDVLVADQLGDRIATRANAGGVLGDMPVLLDPTFDTRFGRAERILLLDVTGDGVDDLIAHDTNAGAIAVGVGIGAGAFGEPVRTSIAADEGALLAIDLDGDGGPSDLFVGASSGGQAAVLRNDGAGGFTAESLMFAGDPRQWAVGDLDGDGLDDVGYVTGSGLVVAVLNDGSGGLALGPIGSSSIDASTLKAGDLDGDGSDELVGINRSSREAVVVSLGGGVFTEVTATLPRTPHSAAIGSVTEAGTAQFVVGVSDTAADLMTFRIDGGALTLVDTTGSGLLPRNFELVDLTGDGFDELVGTTGSNVSVIGNQSGTFASGPGCGAGDYFMNFNVAFQSRSDPDPVFQLRDDFDDWRSDLVGLTDGVMSSATLDDDTIAPGESTTLRIELRDWQGAVADMSTAVPRVIIGGPPTISLGTPVSLGGGVWEVDLMATAGSDAGTAEVTIVIEDTGERPVTLMPPPVLEVGTSCYADLDGDGELTIFDFLVFQNAFDAGDLIADCDGSGALDIFDFLCFQNAFGAGCP
ncbi:MAG: DUF1028 domain-containing protein [Phycisphaera sp.]|nr:MAG: DUF1028 domain-containing protein [Phycisphaera sp.]